MSPQDVGLPPDAETPDDVAGRTKVYEAITRGDVTLRRLRDRDGAARAGRHHEEPSAVLRDARVGRVVEAAATASLNGDDLARLGLLAAPLLPFLPLAAKQILLNNFLSSVPAMAKRCVAGRARPSASATCRK